MPAVRSHADRDLEAEQHGHIEYARERRRNVLCLENASGRPVRSVAMITQSRVIRF